MYMRITWGRVRSGGWDEYRKTYERVVMAHSVQVPGLRARWLVHDQEDTDTGYAVSLWETAGDMEAYERSPTYEDFLSELRPFFVDDFRTSRCEVDFGQQFT